MKKSLFTPLLWGALSLFLAVAPSCSTGIEGTKSIRMSRADEKSLLPSEEAVLISSVRPIIVEEWEAGKKFVVADEKAALVLESRNPEAKPSRGTVLSFTGVTMKPSPGGVPLAYLGFTDGTVSYEYNTGKQEDEALLAITSLGVPMLIDQDIVRQVDSLLKDRTLWIMSPLWYDADEDPVNGNKFVPVRITGARPGNLVFPVLLDFTDTKGKAYSVFLNICGIDGRGVESRVFESLFSLTDPKKKHQSISDEVWDLICKGEVKRGMTKEECKLSLGNPPDVDRGHNWSSTIDLWRYNDGRYLRFEDGVLEEFK